MKQVIIGLDYGTLSARAIAVDASNGQTLGSCVFEYPHGVMSDSLPDGTPLGDNWALQHPQDYLDALAVIVPGAVRDAGINPAEVVGIGLDFTASTTLPADASYTPLCLKERWAHHPHAWVKLWKHHSAQPQADRMTAAALARGESWLNLYGGRLSSEFSLPKLLQVLEEDPEIYREMDEWVEAGDWLVYQMTGVKTRCESCAGFKVQYIRGKGYPDEAYLAALNEDFRYVIRDKFRAPLRMSGTRAGGLTGEMAEKLGLQPGIAVSVFMTDANSCAPAVGLNRAGQMVDIIGTSACHHVLTVNAPEHPDGLLGVVLDGTVPGFYDCESGQSCVGDLYGWFTQQCVPESIRTEAAARGMPVQALLTQLAEKLRPGQSGLMVLDWWNGNRSILNDASLTGLMMGMTLQTRPEEIYRALLEASAYGTRVIIDNCRSQGIPVDELIATGGISRKNALAMQILADVLEMPIIIAGTEQGSALGAAMFGAQAAGIYGSTAEASAAMVQPPWKVFTPMEEHVKVYRRLYGIYRELHDSFSDGNLMRRLSALKDNREDEERETLL